MDPLNRTLGSRAEMDLGLRDYMLGTYRWMAMAMGVTGVTAYTVGGMLKTNVALQQILVSNALMGLLFIGIVMFGFNFFAKRLATMSKGALVTALFVFAAFLGVFASPVAIFYPAAELAKVFFMAVAMFGALSLFGYSTNSNLGTIGRYAVAGFFAFVVISLLGAFIPALRPSGVAGIIMNVIGLGLVAVITAWETQQLKQNYYRVAGVPGMAEKLSIFGAASLLLAFYNIFILLLQLFASRD